MNLHLMCGGVCFIEHKGHAPALKTLLGVLPLELPCGLDKLPHVGGGVRAGEHRVLDDFGSAGIPVEPRIQKFLVTAVAAKSEAKKFKNISKDFDRTVVFTSLWYDSAGTREILTRNLFFQTQ